MQVTLKVIGGKNDGREIKISVPQFIIGRGEQAHLRPSSDLISRQHCAINIGNGQVTVEDMGSRNGTIVNEEVINGPHVAKIGDILKVGRLQFEILIDHAQSGAKKPKVQNVAEVAKRTVASTTNNDAVDEESITDWLAEPLVDDPDHGVTDTRQFRLDETTQLFPTQGEQNDNDSTISVSQENEVDPDETLDSDSSSGIFSRKKKKEKGKLPPKPKFSSETSTSAADDVLKKFFNRR